MSDSTSASPGRHSHDIDELMQRELGACWARRTDSGLCGIALSGGGIRSATFNLGLLQGLQRAGLLQCFDYLSTVSGGGYTGAFWSAWRRRDRANATMLPATTVVAAASEHPALRHLREFSNFLSPRLALFGYDTGRMVVAPIAAGIPSLVVALSVIVAILSLWSVMAWLLLGAGAGVSYGVLAVIVGSVLYLFERSWQRREGGVAAATSKPAYIIGAIAALAVTLLAWRAVRPDPAAFDVRGLPLYHGGADLFAPAAACAAALLALVTVRALSSRWIGTPARRRMQAALDRILARLLFIAIVWSVVSVLWLVGVHLPRLAGEPLANASWSGAMLGTLTAAFLWARKRLERQPNKPAGDSILARLKPRLPQLLAYAAVTLMVLMTVVTLAWWQAQSGREMLGLHPLRAFVAGAFLVIALAALFFHPNRIGLHAFYRGRLARAYPGAANPRSPESRATEELPGDDFAITELEQNRPVHLVCCAANDLTPFEPLASLQRGADCAVLSAHAFSVGRCWRTWQNQKPPTLAGAITASGAAFNSMMGAYSRKFGPASVFLMAALNLRLGRWHRHPHAPRRRPDGERLLPGVLFLKELFGMSSATGADVHLSDGGHFENMGMYELLRRRCRYILAADCGADPDFAFDDVGNLVRRAREDFAIEIRIDLSPLRPGPDGTARQPMVAGDIHYPDGVTGVLLLFKPTLIGSEPADVTQYRSRNQRFPAESTGDQFYDEAQWESYRRLGQFAAEMAFGFVQRDPALRTDHPEAACDDIDERMAARAARIFARARFDWLPHPAGIEDRITDFAERAAALDASLAATHDALHREVMKEAVELRAQVSALHSAPDAEAHARTRSGTAVADGGAPAHAVDPDEMQHASSLAPVRAGALFMEQTYYAWDLETTSRQPLSLGVMNFLARWAYAPLFRMWWPLMRSTLTPQFARFMETQFGLERIPPHRDQDTWVEPVSEADVAAPGFAMQCWEIDNGPPQHPGASAARFFEYRLRLRYRTLPAFQVQAALVRCVEVDGGIRYWPTRDFYVPPGLWGIGIGEDFLRALVRRFTQNGGSIHVRIPVGSRDAAALKTIADESQLYRSAGFRESAPSDDVLRRIAHAGDGAKSVDELRSSTWLVRD